MMKSDSYVETCLQKVVEMSYCCLFHERAEEPVSVSLVIPITFQILPQNLPLQNSTGTVK